VFEDAKMTNYKYSLAFNLFLFLSVTTLTVLAAGCSSSNSPETVVSAQSPIVAEKNDVKNGFDHSQYESLLKSYVDENGKVDYDGFSKDRAKLDVYLDSLGKANPAAFDGDDERNAFYINAYNAFTIRDVLDDVYGKTDSVKKVDGFWDKKKHRVGGMDLTLDKIEKMSRDFKDPRVHFAVNCASTSCPKLQRFAFTGDKLQEQFAFITKDFLADEKRGLKVDRERNKIWISKIFSWYAGDFTGDTSSFGFVKGFIKSKFSASAGTNFIIDKITPETAEFIKKKNPDVSYLDYDWTLNSQIPPAKK
jgi:hypothetical protein